MRLLRWLLPALVACAELPPDLQDELVDEALPPGGRLVIVPQPAMIRGRTHRVPYSDAYGNMRLWLWVSRGFGTACPPQIAPDCLTIADPAALLSVDRARRDGSGAFQFTIPPDAPTGEYALQAGAKNGGGRKQSRISIIYVLDAAADEDGDSLNNAREIDATGTDPLLADTDGGGEDDASELNRFADPLDPSDDR